MLALDGAPIALAPAGPVADSDPEFTWEPVPGAAYYRINVRNAANAVVFNQWFSTAETHCATGEPQCRLRDRHDMDTFELSLESYRQG